MRSGQNLYTSYPSASGTDQPTQITSHEVSHEVYSLASGKLNFYKYPPRT